ncbi:Morn repeat domain containing protein [Pandoravirus macleodensis]|uniref:Morn repeat domain containing protein n=1 Tax=Pandoravirus macleodensis TaxID=2107707 RepID=A0A2U7UFY7_9VIRU|nr:Morn repeat domain containing protein [Pandoravirus macleodensis]AVK77376.1 Morn repeat domain containing protein [Pandoravirus macleodensis]
MLSVRAEEDGRPRKKARTDNAVSDIMLSGSVDSTFSLLPDEIVLVVLRILGTPDVAARAACVSRRLARLAADSALWQHFYTLRHGKPLHQHFAEFGKDWRWLYRARSCHRHKSHVRRTAGAESVSADDSKDIECGHIRLADKHFYWGDLQAGVPHGYGLHMSVRLARDDKTEHASCACALLAQTPSVKWTVHYEGQWKEGQHHGRGFSLILADRRRHGVDFVRGNRHYEGDFVDGEPHGQGRLVWDDGSMFCGRFKNGSRHTPGLYVWLTGSQYDGEWSGRERHGQGTFMRAKKGYSLQCSWRANRPYGWGVCTWNTGQRLEALWDDYVPRGDGVFVALDGRRFVDTASEIFAVGSAMIADDVDPQGEWGGRFRRLREICDTHTKEDDDARDKDVSASSIVKVMEATYPDHSRVHLRWKRNGTIVRVVVLHSVACAQACIEESATDKRSPVPRCMACLCAAS